ncbi:MAG: twitching motility protein PilT [Gammaproteobacteria bacterium]|nr:twitching motility protein PilT [Gammaproteobacteria bacterium]NIR28456.1 twitching motility protein PilT [Gammaproteobacteria bacterium]NIR96902.1 twitching motility protein PilT [Gammaproteobacteria bacterium]NIT62603.1 twitching motility protein PilT [Gammaproteobacteria bacterium]NIV19560.1 twitching motility protein PilT [Gammaproteobacteria bacterium]
MTGRRAGGTPSAGPPGETPEEGGCVEVRCYEELNDFLPELRRKRAFDWRFDPGARAADLLAGLGISPDTVDLVLANGEPVALTYRLRDGDRIALYPVFESVDISTLPRPRARPLRRIRFVVDAHLGRLGVYLRMLGFDTRFPNDGGDDALVRIANEEARILLSRDRALLARAPLHRAYGVQATNPRRQLAEVVARFDLGDSARPLTRCLRCNAVAIPVAKDTVAAQLSLTTRELYREFWRCQGCGRVYWKGPHYRRMRRFIDAVLAGHGEDPSAQRHPGPSSVRR